MARVLRRIILGAHSLIRFRPYHRVLWHSILAYFLWMAFGTSTSQTMHRFPTKHLQPVAAVFCVPAAAMKPPANHRRRLACWSLEAIAKAPLFIGACSRRIMIGSCFKLIKQGSIFLKHNPQSLATHRLLDGSSTNAGDHASGHEGGAPQCPGPSRFRRYRHTPRSMGTDRLSCDLHA